MVVRPGVCGPAVEDATTGGMSRALHLGPVLADQGGAVLGDRAVGLVLEEQLGHAGAGQRVDETENNQAEQGIDDGTSEVVEHQSVTISRRGGPRGRCR